ncbi:MAG: L,D-transpeptidase [Alicyclobacillus herbarius]|uniref:L,D-transpeptidase n=1 Tax=Alicyclobacillus herbarius TaxID=122960 RepID=UPI002355E219|nr:L,D-transpeptidase [Alicyclobacillus herbarius]MCL6631933.1 L,D-transpeptidase [Alicyclobacillus herbarius]
MQSAFFRLAVAILVSGGLLTACGSTESTGTLSQTDRNSSSAAQSGETYGHAAGGQNVPVHQSFPPRSPDGADDAHASPPAPEASSSASTTATKSLPEKAVQKPVVRWDKPSGGPYPHLHPNEAVWIDVSISKQRMYIKSGQKTLYTMVISSGIDGSKATYTPRGTFYVQPERGTWFYTPRFHEGAKYWVSWMNHGQYLFHSVPMDKNGHVILKDAEKLGQEDSHGCIHLTVPDAKWVYEHIPTGTKVVIHD